MFARLLVIRHTVLTAVMSLAVLAAFAGPQGANWN